jgi:tetratricopeptide (TPR) repeat protein
MAKKNSNAIRCLSIRQPWAWLVCAGMKRIENRTWSTDYRGTIAIHASTTNSVVKDYVRNRDTDLFSVDDFAYGAIIGFADIADVKIFGREHEEDGFACGPYCWHMTNPRLLKTPIPMLGKLNLFYLDAGIEEQLRIADTLVVDVNSNSRAAQIASAMHADPDPIAGYAYTLEELDGKIDDDELFVRANRMVEINPENGEGYVCRLRLAIGSQRLETAQDDVMRSLEAFPDDPEVLDLCGRATYMLGDFSRHIEVVDRLFEIEPESSPVLIFQRGIAKMELEQLEGALTDFSHSLANAADSEEQAIAHNFIARVQRRFKNFLEAEKAINLAIDLQPDNANNYYVAARIAEDKADIASARQFAMKSLKVDPNYAEPAELLARLS